MTANKRGGAGGGGGGASTLRSVVQWLLALLAAALFVRTLLHVDIGAAFTHVKRIGPYAPLLILPAAFVLLFESLAWRISLTKSAKSAAISIPRLASIRLATDSLLMSIPGGVVLSEGITPLMLRDQCGLPIAKATAATVARKWLGTRAHALYILLSAAFGWSFLASRSEKILGVPALLPWIVLASAMLPLFVALFTEVAMSPRGAVSKRLWKLLARARSPRWRVWFEARRETFEATDEELTHIVLQDKRRIWASTALYLAAWFCESVEAFAIARALGCTSLSFTQVLAFEAGLSLVRSVVFFAPSGIGVQDLGYVAFFSAAGDVNAAAIGGAFVIVKRARELLSIGLGLSFVLAFLKIRRSGRQQQREREEDSGNADNGAVGARHSLVPN